MATPRIAKAEELRAEIRVMLDAQSLQDVTVTLDPLDIPSGARRGVVVISPPDLTFPTFEHTEADYQLAIIAGPADNLLAAWIRLDEIIEALRVGNLDMETARGDMFTTKHGGSLPGYTVVLNPTTD